MKKIKLKLDELKNPQILTAKQLKSITGGGFCYTGMSCGLGRCVSSNNSGANCMCLDDLGYSPNPFCG